MNFLKLKYLRALLLAMMATSVLLLFANNERVNHFKNSFGNNQLTVFVENNDTLAINNSSNFNSTSACSTTITTSIITTKTNITVSLSITTTPNETEELSPEILREREEQRKTLIKALIHENKKPPHVREKKVLESQYPDCIYSDPEPLASTKHNFTNFINHEVPTAEEVEENLGNLSIVLIDGGKSYTEKNSQCTTQGSEFKRIAFIIPYRDRVANLLVWLNNMHPYLTRQKINYGIYLIEPVENITFNRALLMNIGFVEAFLDMMSISPSNNSSAYNSSNTSNLSAKILSSWFDNRSVESHWDCYIFHDVDMIPEDKRLVYTCNKNVPMHFAVAVKKFGYKTTGYFNTYFGGINGFTKEQFVKINGFSNLFFGWGGEDDDAYIRSITRYQRVVKAPSHIARYYTHDHKADKPNEARWKLLKHSRNLMNQNGLSSLKYDFLSLQREKLFTRVKVSYNYQDYADAIEKLT